MNAPLPLHATSCHALADAPFRLTRIFEPDIQLAQWARPRNPLIADWLDENRNALGTGFRQTLARGVAPDLRALPPGPGRDAHHPRQRQVLREGVDQRPAEAERSEEARERRPGEPFAAADNS